MVVEVLSPATERYDRTRKFTRYMAAESFREYVLVAQDEPRVETYLRRQDGAWTFTPYVGLSAVVRRRSIGVELPMAEVYLKVIFPAASEDADPVPI